MTPQKWKLLSTKDVSPHAWFPIEMRKYELPDGRIVDDFSVTTVADVAMIIPVTMSGELVLVNQFKPGYGEVIMEFPAGRIEKDHKDLEETAKHELEEETGILATEFTYFAELTGFPTKGTEKVYCYLVRNAVFNSEQKPDENEEIEVVTLKPAELDRLIAENKFVTATTIAAWTIAKAKFPDLLN